MSAPTFQEASVLALEAALDDLRERLDGPAGHGGEEPAAPPLAGGALSELVERFALDGFERDVVLLAAGCELDGRFGDLVARLNGDPGCRSPTVSLALSALAGGRWSAFAPDGVLRRARLIDFQDRGPLHARRLILEESVLHGLAGRPQLDERLRPYLRSLLPEPLAAAQERQVVELLEAWRTAEGGLPAAQIAGEPSSALAIAAAACRRAGLEPFALELDGLPAEPADADEILELWARDAVLGDLALVAVPGALEAPAAERAARRLIERLPGFVVLVGDAAPGAASRPLVRLLAATPGPAEQSALWRSALGAHAASLNGQLDRLSQQFTLAPGAIREVAAGAAAEIVAAPDAAGEILWRAARRHVRGGLDELAQRLTAAADWDDLVLPEAQTSVLRSVATHVRQRSRVYEDWGFAAKGPRGLGISALFAGPSGTGKTLAAEVLARDLDLDLYRIDLSAAVSKYIGETEKNLRRIFDAAEASGAILLFDEADALFGKRSEVRDSHDRYANLEVSYLLQRIEAYRGLAILTTNLKRHLDDAFQRRLRFIVQFPHPGPDERAEIWRRAFPPATPVEGLDPAKLARLSITGGHIRSISLHAAVLAAAGDGPVTPVHVLAAARAEYAKLGKTLSDSEVKGWA